MPVKIGFTIVSSTGEDERYRATELNYHGPTVRGWRSAMNCTYPQEIVMQLNMTSVLHRIQILSHQYLIPQKIEIWISEGFECDPSSSPSGVETFEYLGFITLSDNQSTGFKSRELKSITVPPTTARYIKLRLHSNHVNEKNIYNQIGLIAVNVLGDEAQEFDPDGGEVNNNGTYYSNQLYESTLISNPQYVSPYDDLAFAMYVDKDIARIMRVMETKKHKAVLEERFEYASKLKVALEDLREVGETLGKFEQEKRQAINTEDYDKAKLKKLQIDQYREQVYRVLHIDKLLELDGPVEENDLNSNTLVNRSIRKQELAPPHLESLEAEKSVRNQRGISPSQDDISTEREEKGEWDYQSQYKNVSQFNRPPALNQLIHSQSQTSFDRYGSYEENLTPYTSQNFHSTQKMEYPTTLHHSQVFSTTAFQMKTTPYNSHTWQPSTEEASEMYHSMPSQQTLDRRKQILTEKSDAEELPQLQRNYSDGEIKTTLKYSQKTVDFGQPAVQASSTTADIESDTKSQSEEGEKEVTRPKSPAEKNTLSKSPSSNAVHRPNTLRGSVKRRNKSSCSLNMKNSYEAYEERMLPALRHYHANEIVRECQLGLVEPTRKSKLNEREKKQAALPITVFGIELVEKFYSKHFDDKEEGLKQLQEYLKRHINGEEESPGNFPQHSPNKTARAAIFLLHRALRDKVYSVYSSAADTIRLFFSEYVPKRVSSAEVARSVEKLLPELIAKSGDSTPRIHNMAAHTLLSMADCKEVRELHIIPVHLSRPLTSSVHPRLALSRLEMIEQLILNHGISTDKQSGLTCRTLAEFGSSGLHHPAEAVRKVSERILIQVYRVNPRLVRKQLPPDDDITRRNLLYRQLFQEFDFMDMQRKRELNEKVGRIPSLNRAAETQNKVVQSNWESSNSQDVTSDGVQSNKSKKEKIFPAQLPKRTVNQQTSPMKPFSPASFGISSKNESPGGILRSSNAKKEVTAKTAEKNKISPTKDKDNFCNGEQKMTCQLDKRKGMTRITEERSDTQTKNDSSDVVLDDEKNDDEDVSLKFPNLVDSVRVAENKLPFAQKGMRNMKSLKYIFPTSYIGNSTTSQSAVNASNTVNSFCKIVKKPEWGPVKSQGLSNSGIPLPTNRRYTGLFSPMDSSKKFTQSDAEKKAETSFKKIEEDDLHEEVDKKDEVSEISSSMMESLYIDNEANVEEEEGDKEAKEVIQVKNEGRDCNSLLRVTNSDTKNAFRMCIFCFAWENWFTEESLNQHYCNSCPMLTRCSYCKEVVEISGLIQHRLDDCEHRHLFVKCDVCQEAVPKELIKNHECIASESKNPKTRCCQCHSDIGSEDDWREHLMGVNVCPNHPRKNVKEEDTEKRRALQDEETLFL